MARQKRPTADDRAEAIRVARSGIAEDLDLGELAERLAPLHPKNNTHHRGRAAIGHGHQVIFDSIYAGSTVRYQLDVAREIAHGCIVAIATSTLDGPSGPLRGTNQSRITAVLTEQDDRWAIAAFQNTLVHEGS